MSRKAIADMTESDSSSESNSESDIVDQESLNIKPTTKKRREMRKKINDKFNFIECCEFVAHNDNTHLNKYLMFLRIRSFSEKPINMTRSYIFKNDVGFAEKYDIDSFDPERLLEIELRYALYETRKDTGISSDTVSRVCVKHLDSH